LPSARQAGPLTANEAWYLALTRRWAERLRTGGEAGPHHDPTPDIAFAEHVLALRPGMRILDLAASWGRTSLALARRGFVVTALDLSPDLVLLGRERAAAAGLPLRFVQGTVRALPDLGQFDAVCAFYDDCLLSFEDEADNVTALAGVAAVLRPGVGQLETVGAGLGVSGHIIALLLSPVATELPETMNAIIWVRQGKERLALANISGSMMIQATVPSAFGLLFTAWRFDTALAIAAGTTILAIVYLLITIKQHALTARRLAFSAVGYAVFAVLFLVSSRS